MLVKRDVGGGARDLCNVEEEEEEEESQVPRNCLLVYG